ncbi:MAG: Hpt domain-containing protein [Cytophagales bacterium]|nr:Hpt domain-containing protein [Cytophagales bacterium]
MAVTDLAYLREVSDNDAEFMLSMIQTFLDTTPPALNEMKEKLLLGQLVRVGELAHKIKPSITFMGIRSCQQLILDIEAKGKTEVVDGLPELVADLEQQCAMAYDELRSTIENGL